MGLGDALRKRLHRCVRKYHGQNPTIGERFVYLYNQFKPKKIYNAAR